MSTILVKEFHLRSPFGVRRLPILARLYRYAYHHDYQRQNTSWAGLSLLRVLRLLFPLYRTLCRSSTGEFDYERLGRRATIRFNARNLQFQALYVPYFQNGYEPDVAGLLDALLPEGGTFFDIGSNWGYFALYTASNHSRLTVHAFEPQPQSYQDLVSCVEQAGLSGMVVCHNLALSSADGEAFIQMPDGLHSGQAEVSKVGGGGAARIGTRRLDSMGLPQPDCIKLDVEGHEIEVLKGARETLAAARPFIIFENKPDYLRPDKVLDVLSFLAGLGYCFYMPAVQRRHPARSYFMQCGWHPAGEGDLLALAMFEPEMRLLWQHDMNVFACHRSRLPQVMAAFKSWP
jgi:FkbM family methyltransferase